jgi:fructosamine-3-kinase
MKRYMEPWKDTYRTIYNKQQLSAAITRLRRQRVLADEQERAEIDKRIAEMTEARNSLK